MIAATVRLLLRARRPIYHLRTLSSAKPPDEADAMSRLFGRLRRPSLLQSDFLEQDAGRRAHQVFLFPGDFSDDGVSMWDDDDDEDEFGSDTDERDEIELMQQEMRRRELQDQAQRERWIQNSIPPTWTSQIDERGRAYGHGGRKRASARVWIQPGPGEIVVNRRAFVDYFDRMSDRELILEPLVATETCGYFDVQVMVQGGGLTGQAGAVRHGLARALNSYNPDVYRPPLTRLGLLERDARKVERKKVGHVKARKSPQWVRR